MAEIVPPLLHETLAQPPWGEDFWDHAEPNADGCWIWHGAMSHGYGTFNRSTWRTNRAPRIAYMWAHGPMPYARVVDHLCRVPACVNPAHLEAVSERENILRGTGPAAKNAAAETCSEGHQFTAVSDTGWDMPGQLRICLICHYDRSRKGARMAHYRQPTESASSGECSECGRILHVTARGVMHKHFRSPGERCPGSSQPPKREAA